MISVRGLSKSYRIRHQETDHVTIAELALDRIRHPLRRSPREDFWALRQVDFDVTQGEVLGVIGRNGAGKSTLLKVITRITEPTEGRVELWGRVGSLLEVGTGFHPELTGRENVYLNGSILGMSRREIARHFDAIVEFAGVARFLDTPVKRFSNGMYVRLAFAVAAHLQTELLLVDEVLAVGDLEFQRRCLAKMRDVARDGRTVLFVSHHMPSIEELCGRCLFLSSGTSNYYENPLDAITAYKESLSLPLSPLEVLSHRAGTGVVRVVSATAAKTTYLPDETKSFAFVTQRTTDETTPYFLAAEIVADDGLTVARCDSHLVNAWALDAQQSTFTLQLTHPWLRPGTYRVTVYVYSSGVLDIVDPACRFTVIPPLPYPVAVTSDGIPGGQTLPCFSFEVTTYSLASHDHDGSATTRT